MDRGFLGGGGGGGGSRPDGQKTVRTFFFCPQLILQFTKGSNGFITEKTILFQGSRGGVQLFPGGGVQMLISIETHITCDFQGGVRISYPLLWTRTCQVKRGRTQRIK